MDMALLEDRKSRARNWFAKSRAAVVTTRRAAGSPGRTRTRSGAIV